MSTFNLKINGSEQQVSVDGSMPLLWVLRDHLGLVGTKFGCGIGQCGACTVHLEGRAIRSCLFSVAQVGEGEITTIEGLSEDGSHPVQEAWMETDVPQCGYCQAGQLMTASAFLAETPSPSREEIKGAMHGNICRCAAYSRINRAVELASKKITGDGQ
ncbi:(2Fe-2S)-binding protein [Muricauda sp. NFXS6]|uniref:(2Fe-2S)-binding protein n=1 Tax=Allomuricauda sp. NFXS6 TaxID=2819094 RepID=UPI0032DECF75